MEKTFLFPNKLFDLSFWIVLIIWCGHTPRQTKKTYRSLDNGWTCLDTSNQKLSYISLIMSPYKKIKHTHTFLQEILMIKESSAWSNPLIYNLWSRIFLDVRFAQEKENCNIFHFRQHLSKKWQCFMKTQENSILDPF